MKKILLSISLAILFFAAHSQSYTPFPDSNAVWSISASTFNDPTKYAVKGDSIYNSLVYKKYFLVTDTNLANAQFQFYALVRQNITTKKIYGIKNGSTSEKLLYNFNVVINDTFTVHSFDFADWMPHKVKVLAKDSILLLNSQYRKRIKVEGYQNWYGPEYWTEGIGSSFGLFNGGISAAQITDVCFPYLLCYKQNSLLAYKSPTCTTCFDIICTDVGMNESALKNESINLYPNPSNDKLNISFDSETAFKKIFIYNSTGQLIKEEEILFENKTAMINTKDLPNGIYTLQLFDSNSKNISKKIIINR